MSSYRTVLEFFQKCCVGGLLALAVLVLPSYSHSAPPAGEFLGAGRVGGPVVFDPFLDPFEGDFDVAYRDGGQAR